MLSSVKKFLVIAIISFYSFNILADDEIKLSKYTYDLTLDKDMSSISGSDISMSIIEAHRYNNDYMFREDDGILMKTLGYLARFIAANWIMVGNHEVAGHGARIREFNWKVTKYEIGPFSGSTHYLYPIGKDFHLHKELAITTGGMQASHLLSENIQDRSFEKNSINPVYGIHYVITRTDQLGYILLHRKIEEKLGNSPGGDDILAYVKDINKLYGQNYLSVKKLRYAGYIDLLDPFLFYSLYSYAANKNMEIPMIKLGDIRYLPAAKLVLAPYGIERRLINHIVVGDKYFRTNLTYGSNRQKSYSVSVKTNQILKFDSFSLGTEIALWSQPKLLTEKPITAKVKNGGLVSLKAEVPMLSNIKGLLSLGYKTDGFMEGMPLKSSAMLRVGIRINLP